MTSSRVSGTEGYAEEAEALVGRYESVRFSDVHEPIRYLIPDTACCVLDIGSGTGRDAAGFAALGHRVVAVEPTDELRIRAMALHRSPQIEWLADSLPELALLRARGEQFDVVMLTAVWMHLDLRQRRDAMPNIGSLLRGGSILAISLRHGPVPKGRRMFQVSADETIELARSCGLNLVLNVRKQSVIRRNDGVTWTRLAFRKVK